MSDPLDPVALATHGVTALVGGGSVGAFMRWVSGREAEAVSTRLALMEQKLDQLVAGATKADSMREDLALLKQTVQALHERVDRLDGRKRR